MPVFRPAGRQTRDLVASRFRALQIRQNFGIRDQRQAIGLLDDAQLRIEILQPLGRRLDLGLADGVVAEEDLALKILYLQGEMSLMELSQRTCLSRRPPDGSTNCG